MYGVNDIDKFQLFRFVSEDGAPDGEKCMIGDYSDTGDGSTDFYIEAQKDEILLINTLTVHIVDSGTFDSGSYGNGITLTNGIVLFYERNGVKLSINSPFPVKTNVDWGRYCCGTELSSYGAGNEALHASWDISAAGAPITLNPGDKLGVRLNDDFSDLVDHSLLFQGIHIGTPDPDFTTVIS